MRMSTPPGRPMPRSGLGRRRGPVSWATWPSTSGSASASRRRLGPMALAVWMLAAIGGRSGGRETSSDTVVPLRINVEWQLETFAPHSAPPIQVPDPSVYTVRFSASGTVDVRADCNRCAGPVRVAGASMTIGPLGCTLAACPVPTLGEQFAAALTRVSSYVQTPSELILTYDDGTLHFRARP